MGQQCPDWYVRCRVVSAGIGAMLTRLHSRQLANVGLIDQPLNNFTALPCTVDEVRIFFPDPVAERHFKRRLVQVPFLVELQRVLKPGSVVRLATDWAPW